MTTRLFVRTVALAVVAASLNVTLAAPTTKPDRPTTKPTTNPTPRKTDVKVDKNEVKITTDGDFSNLTFNPVPTTLPVKEVIKTKISADAQKTIDQVVGAYKKLKSLELAGSFTGDIDAAGQQSGGKIAFTAAFALPNKFRHDAKDDVSIGSTGEKTFFYVSEDKKYLQADAPKEKVATGDLPKGFRDVLLDQNPSLRLALAKDPARELADNVIDIVKGEDTKIGDSACPTLKLTLKDKTTAVMVIDPATHLIRRVSFDVRAQLESNHVPDIKRALYTIDYTTIKVNAPVTDDQFAWTPPTGAKDVQALAAAAAENLAPAMGLIGKPVPDFKLPGMNGKMVSPADLKGKVYILDFWATWCGPCKASLPHLNKLYQEKKPAGLLVFAVNLKEPKDKIQEFVTSTKLTIPILLDTDGKAAETFMASGIPQTVVVGKDGKVAAVVIGFSEESTPEQLKKAVEEAMK